MNKLILIQENSFGRILSVTARDLLNTVNRVFAGSGFDVTAEQWRILLILSYQDGLSQQQIADNTGKDKTSITRMIDGLEKRKLVARINNVKDRRQNQIILTEKGKKLQKELHALAHTASFEAITGINSKEIKICKSVLIKVCENLSNFDSQ